jgi:hypothetical protein
MDASQQELVEFVDFPNQLEHDVSADRKVNCALSLVGGWNEEVLDHTGCGRRLACPVDDSLQLSTPAILEILPGRFQDVPWNPEDLDAVWLDPIQRSPRLPA